MESRKQVGPERKVVTCSNCGQEREHAAYELCATCYQRQHRAEDNPWAAAHKHDAQRLRAQRSWRRALNKILDGTEDAIDILSEQEAAAIRTTVQLHLSRLVNGLAPVPLAVVPAVLTLLLRWKLTVFRQHLSTVNNGSVFRLKAHRSSPLGISPSSMSRSGCRILKAGTRSWSDFHGRGRTVGVKRFPMAMRTGTIA
jgi:ribosomal protein L37E